MAKQPNTLHREMATKMWLIMLGGALGCYLRYLVTSWCNAQPWGQGFPFGTLAVNVGGCLVLGATAAILAERAGPAHQVWFLLIGTGFCGGVTTFSSFELDTYRLVREGGWWLALANVTGSVVAGFAGLLAGIKLVTLLLPRA